MGSAKAPGNWRSKKFSRLMTNSMNRAYEAFDARCVGLAIDRSLVTASSQGHEKTAGCKPAVEWSPGSQLYPDQNFVRAVMPKVRGSPTNVSIWLGWNGASKAT